MRTQRNAAIAALLLLAVAPATAQVPRAVFIEEGGATWCGYCPRARAGVAVMLSRYDATEIDAVEYLDSSGGLSCPDADARNAYNQVGGFPQLAFNGGSTIAGAGTDAVNGSTYDPVVRGLLDDATPLAMRISGYSLAVGSAYVTVELNLEEDLADISQTRLRVAVVEDKVPYNATQYNDVLRDMLPDQALTISEAGQSQQVTLNFTVDPAWLQANLRLVAFVQDDRDRSILQSANSRPTPSYALRYYAQGARTAIAGGTYTFGEAALFNTGINADTYDVTLVTTDLPADWTARLVHEGQDVPGAVVPLAPGERARFNVVIDAASAGQGSVVLNLHAQSGGTPDRQLAYKVITPDTRVLLIDDDGAAAFETLYFAPALAAANKTYGVWDRSTSSLKAADLAHFDMVVWECGLSYPTVDAADREALAGYLDGGGRLLITGQEIGWEMADTGGDALVWYNTYLHANFVNDDTNDMTITGVAGDPIGNGLSLTISGAGGANNQTYPDAISPRGTEASACLIYSATYTAGIRADNGVHKVVYLGFGFEAINSAASRALVMQRVCDWLIPYASGVGDGAVPTAASPPVAAPNPFNPRTGITFSLPAAGPVRLDIYDIRGRLVRVLDEGERVAGPHTVVWDGCDAAGQPAPSGTYLCRLRAGEQGATGKLMLVR
ncbi:MAG: hypothetical protein IPK64_04130 [bacterium]|nr:hypothetical protein [bacterium]